MSKQSSVNSSSSLSSINSSINSSTTTLTKSSTSTSPFYLKHSAYNNSTLKFGFNRIRCHYPNVYNHLSAIEKNRENFWSVDIRKNAKNKMKIPHYSFNNGISSEQMKQVTEVAEQIWFCHSIAKLLGKEWNFILCKKCCLFHLILEFIIYFFYFNS